MKKFNLKLLKEAKRKIAKLIIGNRYGSLNEQANLGWTGAYAHLNYGVDINTCYCADWDGSNCNGQTYQFNNLIIPYNVGTTTPVNLNPGDIIGGAWAMGQNDPQYVSVVVSTIPYTCNANDPGINNNPANCPGGAYSMPIYVAAPGQFPTCAPTTPPIDSWNCVDNNCVDPGDGSGTFSSLADCTENCGGGGTDPVLDIEKCCDWCDLNHQMQPQGAGIPPSGCHDWMCNHPKYCRKRGDGELPGHEEKGGLRERFQKLANIIKG